jgi:predicted dehydrogenase
MVQRDPVSVSASGLTAFSQAVDHAVAHLHFHGGPLLTLTASRITEQKVRSIEVMATEAFIEANLLNKTISVHRRTLGEYVNLNHRGVKYRQESVIECIHVPAFEPLYLELEHFVDCVAEGKPTKVPAEDGLKALGLATAIRESLEAQLVDAAPTAKLWQPSPVAAPMAMAAS